MALSARQLLAVQVSERTMSVLSILGSLFIISTFLRWHYFRKPINRLVFYASFGNMLTNVATLISTSALPGQGASYYSLCEFQGILIQWFMMADTLWVFSMALNVMLVFFRGYNSRQLLRLEKWYLLFGYGAPGVIAITYIIMYHRPNGKKVIGPATIWCWVAKDVEWMRLAFFYAPIWVIIGATMCIYVATGYQIFKKRADLRSFTKIPDQEQGNTLANPFTVVDFRNIKVETEMKVETSWKTNSMDQDTSADPSSRGSFSSTRELSHPAHVPTISTPPQSSAPAGLASQHKDGIRTGYKAIAFATNQIPDSEGKHSHSFSINQHNSNRRRTAAMESNAAAWGYFKVAFLMFTALFIVWVPSTVNRLQQFIDKDHPIFGLNLASALVLPLQGFWNSMIYVSTTWPECKRALAETLDALSSRRTARRHQPHGKGIPYTSTMSGIQNSESPIRLDVVNNRPESQRYLKSISSAESVRAGAGQSE